MRILNIKLLVDIDDDDAACDFASETFNEMPFVVDWGHAKIPKEFDEEYTKPYTFKGNYTEGQFLQETKKK